MSNTIKTLLIGLTSDVYNYTAPANKPLSYVVYGKDGENVASANDRHAETADEGYIDLFTKNPEDPLIESIPLALDAGGVAYSLESIQYEEETGYLHYEWIWEV